MRHPRGGRGLRRRVTALLLPPGLAVVRSIVHAPTAPFTAHANPDGGLTVRAKPPLDPG
ncbi:hypothetical protein [Streptomyces albipurpureus]|uniref:Uncharacterized protein n=1 Tax=Streptomyces albipurpureus TaxID=2897419 RepID=A0ABT0UJJ0_9ACTN|nr:hypothetical protein [Streptomyces sp. CWNU-1]MCM2388356.1 hypothetical protein [Streptomyces sp. CWNU-1]